jgi:hypothetical protein
LLLFPADEVRKARFRRLGRAHLTLSVCFTLAMVSKSFMALDDFTISDEKKRVGQ